MILVAKAVDRGNGTCVGRPKSFARRVRPGEDIRRFWQCRGRMRGPDEAQEIGRGGTGEHRMNKVLKEIINTLLYLLCVLLLTLAVNTYVGQRTEVEGSSMEPTLSDKDNLIVDKISYRFQEPERFDIIVFSFKYKEDTYYIKRIIGLPGETVRIDEEGNIYINDEILEESYGREVIKSETMGLARETIVIGEDEYFVLGDNRNNSTDSRSPLVGNVNRKDIIGRAFVRIWPLAKMGMLRHQ